MLVVVPVYPIRVVSTFLSIPSFPANHRRVITADVTRSKVGIFVVGLLICNVICWMGSHVRAKLKKLIGGLLQGILGI